MTYRVIVRIRDPMLKCGSIPLLVLNALVALGSVGCYDPMARYECVDPEKIASEGSDEAFFASAGIWRRVAIPVCWPSGSWAATTAADRDLVRAAVEETWEPALAFELVPAEEHVHFVGWGECGKADGPNDGIRISATFGSSKAPHTSGLGSRIAGKNDGMVLEFSFTNWSPGCSFSERSRQYCMRVIAIHEFGHALGFAHEQNRPDTDREVCDDAPQGTNGDLLVGPWDKYSVMNYCNPYWNNDGVLSDGDELGIRAAYYPGLFNFECVGKYRERHPILKD